MSLFRPSSLYVSPSDRRSRLDTHPLVVPTSNSRCAKCHVECEHNTNLLLLSDGSPVCENCAYICSVCQTPIHNEAIVTGALAVLTRLHGRPSVLTVVIYRCLALYQGMNRTTPTASGVARVKTRSRNSSLPRRRKGSGACLATTNAWRGHESTPKPNSRAVLARTRSRRRGRVEVARIASGNGASGVNGAIAISNRVRRLHKRRSTFLLPSRLAVPTTTPNRAPYLRRPTATLPPLPLTLTLPRPPLIDDLEKALDVLTSATGLRVCPLRRRPRAYPPSPRATPRPVRMARPASVTIAPPPHSSPLLRIGTRSGYLARVRFVASLPARGEHRARAPTGRVQTLETSRHGQLLRAAILLRIVRTPRPTFHRAWVLTEDRQVQRSPPPNHRVVKVRSRRPHQSTKV